MAAGAGLATAWTLLPDAWRFRLLISLLALVASIAVAIVLFALLAVPWAVRRERARLASLIADGPPIRCPKCRHIEHEWKGGGHWIGLPDPVTGKRAGGWDSFGICKACGCRWKIDHPAEPHVATEEEWSREVDAPAARRAEELRQWTEHHPRRLGPKPIDY